VIKQYRKSLLTSDIQEISKSFFGNLKFSNIFLGDINHDGKEEILLGIKSTPNGNIYDKVLVLSKVNGNYDILLKIYGRNILGKDEELLKRIPQVKFKVTIHEDKIFINFYNINLKPIKLDQIELRWSKENNQYFVYELP
jgi:hypothetical protein